MNLKGKDAWTRCECMTTTSKGLYRRSIDQNEVKYVQVESAYVLEYDKSSE